MLIRVRLARTRTYANDFAFITLSEFYACIAVLGSSKFLFVLSLFDIIHCCVSESNYQHV